MQISHAKCFLARAKTRLSTFRWTPRTVICALVFLLLPGGLLIAPLLFGVTGKADGEGGAGVNGVTVNVGQL